MKRLIQSFVGYLMTTIQSKSNATNYNEINLHSEKVFNQLLK